MHYSIHLLISWPQLFELILLVLCFKQIYRRRLDQQQYEPQPHNIFAALVEAAFWIAVQLGILYAGGFFNQQP